jgi:hypothetical protein
MLRYTLVGIASGYEFDTGTGDLAGRAKGVAADFCVEALVDHATAECASVETVHWWAGEDTRLADGQPQPPRESTKRPAKVVSHGRYVTFHMAEVALSRQLFADILSLITRLRAPPAPA